MANKQNTLSRKLLEFYSLLTGDAQSAILAGNPTTSGESSSIPSHLPNTKEICKEMWTVGR